MSIPDGVHDLGCHCWPHVSVREVQARTAERDAALARAERAEAAVATLRERVGHDDDCDAGLDDANECTCPSGPVLSDTEAAATATIERIRQAERERIAEAVIATLDHLPRFTHEDGCGEPHTCLTCGVVYETVGRVFRPVEAPDGR